MFIITTTQRVSARTQMTSVQDASKGEGVQEKKKWKKKEDTNTVNENWSTVYRVVCALTIVAATAAAVVVVGAFGRCSRHMFDVYLWCIPTRWGLTIHAVYDAASACEHALTLRTMLYSDGNGADGTANNEVQIAIRTHTTRTSPWHKFLWLKLMQRWRPPHNQFDI